MRLCEVCACIYMGIIEITAFFFFSFFSQSVKQEVGLMKSGRGGSVQPP